MDEIPVILNPAARSAKASGRVAAIQELSPRVKLFPTTGPSDARRFARELAEKGAKIVVAAGGDGTINEVVNGLRDAGPGCETLLGLLPSGTMNVFSVELGLPAKDLAACWKVIERGNSTTVDLWDVGGHAFVQLAGVGLDAEIIKQTTWERKRALGPLSYVLSAAQLMSKAAPQVLVHSEGRESLQGSVVLVGNGKRYGGPFKVFPQARNDDGLLDVVVLREHGYGKVFSALMSLLLSGYEKAGKGLTYFQTRELRIEGSEQTSVEADGELITSTLPLVIKKSAESLRVLV